MYIKGVFLALIALCVSIVQANYYLFPREEFGLEQIYQRGVYDRNVDSFQEPSDFHTRHLHEINKRDNEFYDRIADALYKRELNRLNSLFGRTLPRPIYPPAKSSTHGSSRKSPGKGHGFGASGSSHSSDTDESTDTSKIVGMAKIKTSHDKSVNIVGVQGCTGIFLHGDGFITGAHATPPELPQTAARAAQEAMRSGTVTGIRIYGPSAANVNIVKATIERLIPHIIAYVQIYHDQPVVYDWEFKATQAGAVTMTRIPV